MNNFEANFAFGVTQYRHLLDTFYKHYCYDGRFVCIGDIEKSHCSDVIQRQLKTDTMIQRSVRESYGVEEKVASWPINDQPHTAFFLETRSCTNPGRESDGWMHSCQADLLLYAFEIKDVGLLIYLLNFVLLKRWFWGEYLPSLPNPDYGLSVMPNENRTEGRVVAIATAIAAVPTRCFLVTFSQDYRVLKPEVDVQRLRRRYQPIKGVENK